VQKLFNRDFCDLRDDVAVLTYNYDAYLDFVLSHAFMARKEAVGKPIKLSQIPTAVLGGLHNGDADDLLSRKGFCFLKLHGTSVLPAFDQSNDLEPRALTFKEVFGESDQQQLIARLNSPCGPKSPIGEKEGTILTPPIFFPWEIINDKGGFVSEQDFRRVEGVTSTRAFEGKSGKTASYYSLFKAIWKRAQREISESEQVSFVGFSAHNFMKLGLRFLFQNRRKISLRVVTANPESVCLEALEGMLKDIGVPSGRTGFRVKGYPTFKSFIDEELFFR
jgi:hypothetical protein